MCDANYLGLMWELPDEIEALPSTGSLNSSVRAMHSAQKYSLLLGWCMAGVSRLASIQYSLDINFLDRGVECWCKSLPKIWTGSQTTGMKFTMRHSTLTQVFAAGQGGKFYHFPGEGSFWAKPRCRFMHPVRYSIDWHQISMSIDMRRRTVDSVS